MAFYQFHKFFLDEESTLNDECTKEKSEFDDNDDLLEIDDIMITEEEQDIAENLALDLYGLK